MVLQISGIACLIWIYSETCLIWHLTFPTSCQIWHSECIPVYQYQLYNVVNNNTWLFQHPVLSNQNEQPHDVVLHRFHCNYTATQGYSSGAVFGLFNDFAVTLFSCLFCIHEIHCTKYLQIWTDIFCLWSITKCCCSFSVRKVVVWNLDLYMIHWLLWF